MDEIISYKMCAVNVRNALASMEFDDSSVLCHIICCTVQGVPKKSDTIEIILLL